MQHHVGGGQEGSSRILFQENQEDRDTELKHLESWPKFELCPPWIKPGRVTEETRMLLAQNLN
jgi:hypothetical protein